MLNPKRRRENDVSYLIQYLDQIRDARHDKKERKRKEYRIHFRKNLTVEQKAYIVYLRYGSLTDDSNPIRTHREVGEITGIKVNSCTTVCQRWKRDGFTIKNNCKGCPSNRKITPEIEQQLVNPKLLKEWRHLSLDQRCMKFEQMFGFRISNFTLRLYYKKNKINYIKPQYAYLRKLTMKEELN